MKMHFTTDKRITGITVENKLVAHAMEGWIIPEVWADDEHSPTEMLVRMKKTDIEQTDCAWK